MRVYQRLCYLDYTIGELVPAIGYYITPPNDENPMGEEFDVCEEHLEICRKEKRPTFKFKEGEEFLEQPWWWNKMIEEETLPDGRIISWVESCRSLRNSYIAAQGWCPASVPCHTDNRLTKMLKKGIFHKYWECPTCGRRYELNGEQILFWVKTWLNQSTKRYYL